MGIGRGQQAGNLPQFGAGLANGRGDGIQALTGVAARKRQKGLRFAPRIGPAMLLLTGQASAGERVPLGETELLDLQKK